MGSVIHCIAIKIVRSWIQEHIIYTDLDQVVSTDKRSHQDRSICEPDPEEKANFKPI
jgi:hypothetical protein